MNLLKIQNLLEQDQSISNDYQCIADSEKSTVNSVQVNKDCHMKQIDENMSSNGDQDHDCPAPKRRGRPPKKVGINSSSNNQRVVNGMYKKVLISL